MIIASASFPTASIVPGFTTTRLCGSVSALPTSSVIRSPDINGDLADYRRFLPENLQTFDRQKVPFIPVPLDGGTPQ